MDGLNIEIYRPDPRPKFFLTGKLGGATVNGLSLTTAEAEELVEALNEALAEAELG